MSDTLQHQEFPAIPEAVAEPKKHFSLQLVWLIPIVAALIGGTLAIKSYLSKGPIITITFRSGEGLEVGKTKIKYRNVDVGVVKDISIAKDFSKVVVTAELHKDTSPYLVEDTRFWVVRPRIAGGNVSGLGTLMGGAFIGMDVGKSTKTLRSFQGREIPPAVTMDVPGSRFQLHSNDLGSLDIGSPIFFRRIQVGQVTSYELDRDGRGVTFRVFVSAPYDQYVKENTRFWNDSGVDLTLDASGVKLNTQSIVSLLVGGICFQTLDEDSVSPPPGSNTTFTLFPTRDEAMKHRDTISQNYVLIFKESVRGLSPGAPVDFRGLVIGEVSDIHVELDRTTREINMRVDVKLFPERYRSRAVGTERSPMEDHAIMNRMVERGLRAQLKSGNLLTGQLYVSLDFFPNAPKAKMAWNTKPPQIPTTPGSLNELQETLAQILKKIDKIPLDKISAEVQQALQSLDSTIKNADKLIQRVDSTIMPEARATLEEARKTLGAAKQTLSADAPLQHDLREALREVARAAQSLRGLTDYLERHPEALIRGKQEESP
jgi:paraquat-inducible protein B